MKVWSWSELLDARTGDKPTCKNRNKIFFIFLARAMKLSRMIDMSLLIIRILLFLKLVKKWLSYGRNTYAHIWARAQFSVLLFITLASIIILQWKFLQWFFFMFLTICTSFRSLVEILLVAVGENFQIWLLEKFSEKFLKFSIFNIYDYFQLKC